jgi:predicted CoA-binding protein
VQGATITNMRQRMEESGLVRRRRDPEDNRLVRVFLTRAGRKKGEPSPDNSRNLRALSLKELGFITKPFDVLSLSPVKGDLYFEETHTQKPEIRINRMDQVQQKTLEELRQILTATKTIAVVGLSDKPDRPSHTIPAYLQEQGYHIIPVNPRLSEALGEKAYPSLRDVPVAVDVVEIFRRAEDVPPLVEEAIAIGAKVVWMQLGIVNEEAAARAEAAGLTVVMDTCMGATHRLLRSKGEI